MVLLIYSDWTGKRLPGWRFYFDSGQGG